MVRRLSGALREQDRPVARRCFAPVEWLVDHAVGRVAWSRSSLTVPTRVEPNETNYLRAVSDDGSVASAF